MKTDKDQQIHSFAGNTMDAGNYAGLTKREHFAGLAMAAYAGADYVGNSGTAHSEIAEWAVSQADALINALNKGV